MNALLKIAVAAGVALAVSILATALMIFVSRSKGWVVQPRHDRWHKRPTALYGGVAVFVAFMVAAVPFVSFDNLELVGVLVGGALMFGAGILDDAVEIKASSKLLAQIVAACVMLLFGIKVIMVLSPWLSIPLTVLWLVGITNAFNLLDNMDGLSSGIACIASGFVVGVSMANQNYAVAVLAAAMLGACAGFLVFNFHPAKIFMGDGGSLFVGFVLGGSCLIGTWEHASNLFLVLSVPVLVLAVPIFDTTLVTITRRLQGRPVSMGGKDHSSHRLVALGVSEPRAVLLLWLFAGFFGATALVGVYLGVLPSIVLAGLATIVLLMFGIYLGQQHIYYPVDGESDVTEGVPSAKPASKRWARLDTKILYKRRVAEVLGDTVLITVALIGAYVLRFEGHLEPFWMQAGLFLPLAIAVKLCVFFVVGMYRTVWRYTSIRDMLTIFKAVTISSALFVISVLMLTRFAGVSRTLFVLDFVLTLLFVGGARVLIRVFRETLEVPKHGQVAPALVIGAGDTGEMVVRELRQKRDLGVDVVGFVDDDPGRRDMTIHGIPVLADTSRLEEIVRSRAIRHVVLATPRAPEATKREFGRRCEELGVDFSVVQLKQTLSLTPLGKTGRQEGD